MKMSRFIVAAALAVGLCGAASASPLPSPTDMMERPGVAVDFTKWKAKHWRGHRGRHYGWNRGRHRGWYKPRRVYYAAPRRHYGWHRRPAYYAYPRRHYGYGHYPRRHRVHIRF